ALPRGQALFYGYDPFCSYHPFGVAWERYASLWSSVFADSARVEFWAMQAIHARLQRYGAVGGKDKSTDAAGAKLLKAITDYSKRAGTAGLPQDYGDHGYAGPEELAQLLRGIFRNLADAPSAPRPANALPIRFLDLRLPEDQSNTDAWIQCEKLARIEDR